MFVTLLCTLLWPFLSLLWAPSLLSPAQDESNIFLHRKPIDVVVTNANNALELLCDGLMPISLC